MRPIEATLLHRAQRSGGSTAIEQGEASAAIRLGLMKLATITGEPQRVVLTAQGRAMRAEWAA